MLVVGFAQIIGQVVDSKQYSQAQAILLFIIGAISITGTVAMMTIATAESFLSEKKEDG